MLVLANCSTDETLTGYGAADQIWILESIDGSSFPAGAQLSFPEEGRVAGRGPCNQFFGAQRAPYPWFDVGPLAATKRACPDLAVEAEFLRALEAMTLSEVVQDTLILSTEDGRQMVFRSGG